MCWVCFFFQKWKIGYNIIKTKYASDFFLYPICFCVFQSLFTSYFFAPPLSIFFFLSPVYCYVVRRIPAGISTDPWPCRGPDLLPLFILHVYCTWPFPLCLNFFFGNGRYLTRGFHIAQKNRAQRLCNN